jgi:aspartyl-tRNA(Asn)/glutamyl-tRNA(Gln) amidotransferase subunit A
MSEIADWSLVETADAISARRISAREATSAALARVEARQGRLNAFVRLDAEGALRQAEAIDADLAAGRRPGPLAGVPMAHKDMFYRAGVPCTCGSAIRRNFVPDVTATVLERLDAAGSVTLGALNMSEFASGPTGHNVHFGATHNPWHLDHITGGSSTGSGTAVGGRLVSGALGSDTGGSVRLPAAICGVHGVKPTQGRVSRYGCMGLSFSCDTIGPLARTARDCARLLGVLAGADPLDPTALPAPVDDYEGGLDEPVRGLRLAVPTNYYWDDMVPEIGDALETAIATLGRLGLQRRAVTVPHHDILGGLANVLIYSEGCTLHEHWLVSRPQDYSPLNRARNIGGFAYTAVEYLQALQARAGIGKSFIDQVFGEADVLALPVLRFPVPTLAETDAGDRPDLHTILGRLTHCTRPINYLGLPSVSCPIGFSTNGLPIAVQLVGRPFAEALLLRVAHHYERETRWTDRLPPL